MLTPVEYRGPVKADQPTPALGWTDQRGPVTGPQIFLIFLSENGPLSGLVV